jgi:tetratricopeptide (TPR) repeat protein
MKKYCLIIALSSGCCLQVHSQYKGLKADSLKIDSLKKLLPPLKGTNRVDCMKLICDYYYDAAPGRKASANDSIYFYGNKILNESKALGYKKGIAIGLLCSLPDSLKEKNTRDAIRIGEEIGNDEVLGWGYSILSGITPDFRQSAPYYQKSIDHFHKAGNALREAAMSNWLSQAYMGSGEFEKAFDYERNAVNILKALPSSEFAYAHSQTALWSLWNMSELYSAAGDYEGALNYMRMTNQADMANDTKTTWGHFTLDISGIFVQIGQYDSARVYWDRCRNDPSWNSTSSWQPGRALAYNYLGNIYLATKQYDKAIEIFTNNNTYFDSLIKYSTGNFKHAGKYGRMVASLWLGQAYNEKKNYEKALQYAKEGFNLAQGDDRRPEMMQGYQLLSSVYHHLNNNDSAYEYLTRYNTIKDSIQNKQFLLRIYNSKKDAEYENKQAQLSILDKDNKLKGEQLKQKAKQTNFLFILLSALMLTGIFVFRAIYLKRKNERLKLENALTVQRLESEKKHADLKRQASDLQMQALRAQMNPHFIFNSLSSINWFIMENDKDVASDYLTRFSKLMRMVLNAQKPTIPLEDELKMLQLYLDMERLRLGYSFEYSITFTNAVDAGTVSIPPMLLQPFCENAIWHGFMNKEDQGQININIKADDHFLECTITDNGIGRKEASAFKKKSAKKDSSMGLFITRERLALFSQENNADADLKIEDLADENGAGTGTRVILNITYKELIEEPA